VLGIASNLTRGADFPMLLLLLRHALLEHKPYAALAPCGSKAMGITPVRMAHTFS